MYNVHINFHGGHPMKNIGFRVSYTNFGEKFSIPAAGNTHYAIECEETENAVKAKIIAKSRIELDKVDIIYDHLFESGDKFFGNGYQAWTTSREYTRQDKMVDMTPIAATKKLKKLAGISGDVRFVKFPKKSGEFFSHCYTYIRNGEKVFFIGSLSERQGFTVIYADMNKSLITLEKDVEGVILNEGESYELFDVVKFTGTYDEVFDKYFEAMKLAKPRLEHMSGYTSWYNYFQKIDEKIIIRDLNALDVAKDSVSIFQIDDGYETFVGDWLDPNPAKFPKGMKYVADSIHEKGYMAGIWLAPFSLQRTSRMYKEHPDWILRDKYGLPILGVVAWGGAYTMDMYHPEARAYIKHFFDVILNEWGYDMVKLDFLYSQCMYPRNGKSRGTIMCEAMEFLRECCGDKFILGCGVPLGAAFGYVDACRIGCDVDLKYTGKFYNALHVNTEVPSAQNSITNAIFRRHLSGRAFCNDPDVFFLRYSNLDFTMDQKLILAGVNHIFGDVLFVSDNAEEYTANDVEVLKKTFAKSEAKVISAEFTEGTNIRIELEINGENKAVEFDLAKGESNIREVLYN